MSFKLIKSTIIYCALTLLLTQCKSQGSVVHNKEASVLNNKETLVIEDCLQEHQFEGKDSVISSRVEIVNKNTKIPRWAFAIIPTLEEVHLNADINVLDDNAFYSCKNLKKINLNNVDTIGENCFKFTSIEKVNLRKVRVIKEFAFSSCYNLKEIEFSDSLRTIGEFAFSNDTALVSCHIPEGKVETGAFMGCTMLKKLSFGNAISIGNAAFLDCVSLTSICIPSTIQEIQGEAFSGCVNLKEVIINSQETKIAKDAFDEKVTIIYNK